MGLDRFPDYDQPVDDGRDQFTCENNCEECEFTEICDNYEEYGHDDN